MKRKIKLIPVLVLSLICLFTQAVILKAEPTNYNSGISVLFGGTQGTDWDEEVFWHNPVEDDHKVVYIKEDTLITMQHNERNILTPISDYRIVGVDGGGIIRYRVDRDLQIKHMWSGSGFIYPEYTGPFTLGELTYGMGYSDDDSNVPVVGSTGDNGQLITDREAYYHYGCLDEFGDEWHTLAFADDDRGISGSTDGRTFSSDGKTILFIVNPRTPLINFNKLSSDSQFYTTPPKHRWIPKVHSQITYLTDNVEIELINIMGGNIYYRFDNLGEFLVYTDVINSNTLSDGKHTLEYYYNASHIKVRKIIKNPSYPSDNDVIQDSIENSGHGYLLWRNDNEFEGIKARLSDPARVDSYGLRYSKLKTDWTSNGYRLEVLLGSGERRGPATALENALLAKVEGWDYTVPNFEKTAAGFTKAILLDNVRKLDDLGLNWGVDAPTPTREINYQGYYDVNIIFKNAFAYDLIISDFRSSRFSGGYADGITPIEDHKIRDNLAKFVFEAMLVLGRYTYYSNITNMMGMNGIALGTGALISALAMPSYNTHYYGTSGFDGSSAGYNWTPYPDHPVTWKQAFYLCDTQLHGYPNQALKYTIDEMITTEPVVRPNDGITIPEGSFTNRISYYGYYLMGHVFHILANVMKIKFDYSYPYLEKSFVDANETGVYGYQVNTQPDYERRKFVQVLLVNERFPNVAGLALENINTEGMFSRAGSSENADLNYWMYLAKPYGLILYHDDWELYAATTPGPESHEPDESEPESEQGDQSQEETNLESEATIIPDKDELICTNNVINPGKGGAANIVIKLKERKKVRVVIYDGKGIKIKIIANEVRDANTYNEGWNGKDDSGNTVGSGVYMVFMEAGGYKETKKIVVVK